ncbi:MAG: hypothetical protein ACLFOY_07505 [Desulfatibacillaceae bacterium]
MSETLFRERSRKPWIYGILLAVLFIVVGIAAWSSTQCTRVGYEISTVAAERAALTSLRERLRVELAHLKSPERIIRIGNEELGLVMPDSEQVVVVQ